MANVARVKILGLFLALFSIAAVARQQGQVPASADTPATGMTSTLLPDGSWLLLGGQDVSGRPVAAIAIRDAQGKQKSLPITMRFARTWHTATVMTDGSVLILGGVGSDGRVVQAAELFHPESQTIELLPSSELPERVFHSNTLLTEGQSLVAGGVSPSGEVLKTIELIDSRTKSTIVLPAELAIARRNHTATLLPDGRVLLWGGKDAFGQPLNYGEIYDPKTQSTNLEAMPLTGAADSALPFLAASLPADGDTDVPVDTLIALRFSKVLRVETVNSQTVTLQDPAGATISAKVVAAEGGMLGFITPAVALNANTTYTVTLKGLSDSTGLEFNPKIFTFTTGIGDGEQWIPKSLGEWQTGRPDSPWRALPPLQAAPGMTAISAQVLTLDGKPLPNVTMRVGNLAARTDATGRFLLTALSAGHVVMFMDGRTASHGNKTYGTFEVGVDVKAGQTNVLTYTIWFPLIDTEHQVTIPSPTTTEVVVTTPLIPGFELHIPPNTVITDYDGQVVHQVGITPIPVDRPPFPLEPNVYVPIYFTAQPGGAYVKNYTTGEIGVRVIYPNYKGLLPGSRANFWHYNPDGNGWYIYGKGTVTPDSKQVVPDPGVSFYSFTGAMFNPFNLFPPGIGPLDYAGNWKPPGKGADPVDLGTGLFVYTKTDLFLSDLIPISLTRTYRQGDSNSGPFGIGTWHQYEMYVWNPTQPQYQEVDLVIPDGGRIHYSRISSGTSWTDAVFQNTTSNGAFYNSQIAWNGNGWNLALSNGTVYIIGENAPLQAIRDRYGNQLTITRSNGQSGTITQLTSPNGRWIKFTYDTSNRITQATDNIGRTVLYSYDSGGRLTKVIDVSGGIWQYSYDSQNQMTSITDARNIQYLQNVYGSYQTINGVVVGKVIKQIVGAGSDQGVYSFSYAEDGTGTITSTDVTDPNGHIRRVFFATPQVFPDGFQSGGVVTSEIRALNLPEQQTTTYSYTGTGGPNHGQFLQGITDAIGRTTSLTYDAMGNTTSITRLAGTPQAVTVTFAYEPAFNRLASVTDPLGHTTAYSYDTRGNLIAVTDPLGNQTLFTANSAGQLTLATDPLGNSVKFAYSGADLASVTDPLGNVSARFFDGAGRLLSTTDALGHSLKYEYNNFNLLTQFTDAQGNNAAFGYDPNGNLLTLTDALKHSPITWTYDSMDRPQTRTDQLMRQEGYSYDKNGNRTGFINRKNQTTSFTYDGLNRLTFVGFNAQVNGGNTIYDSKISYTYDAGNRIRTVLDSTGGTITDAYDNLDRLTTETTAQGSISYNYDNADRRTSMTVVGQPELTYTYDNANRLTQMTQGSSSVAFGYDSANHRTSLSLPNGVSITYSYDSDSRVTGLTYTFGTTVLGNLSYAYDSIGHRTAVAGGFARTGMPGPVGSASYDAANELTNWNGTILSHDDNGNMLSDGTNSFSWNARNQLATLNNVSLQYDAFGRRTQNAAGKSFLYDGPNIAQEFVGSSAVGNILVTGMDQLFQRTDGSGTVVPLADVLGSIIALTDSNGNIVTTYSYDPYGNTTSSGTPSVNAMQYTGRENEGNGLYFYRGRYYSPLFGRFVSEDPLGILGGDVNFYAYVGDSPTNFRDPTGLQSLPINRAPDYYTATVGYTTPIGVQASTSVTWDTYGNVYWTPLNAGIGYPPGPGGSVTAGWLDPFPGRKPPDPDKLNNFIKGWGGQMCGGGSFVGACQTWSPGNGWATEVGLMSPQGGLTGNYTWQMNPEPSQSDPLPPSMQHPPFEIDMGDGFYYYPDPIPYPN